MVVWARRYIVRAAALLCVGILLCAAAESTTPVADLLQKANAALASYDYAGALEAYDQALVQEPDAWLTYFRRSTAYQALGRTGAALADLQAAIDRNPQLAKAYLQRARIHLKEGDLALAKDELKRMSAHVPKKGGSEQDLAQADALKERIAHAEKLEKQLAKLENKGPKKAAECVAVASELLDTAPNHTSARAQRAHCFVQENKLEDALTDWNRIAHLAPTPTMQLRLALLSYYVLGTRGSQLQDAGLAHLKACLHNDPDNKRCIQAHKQLRRTDKAIQKARNFADAESWSAVVSALKGAKVGGPTLRDEVIALLHSATKGEGGHEPVLPPEVTDPASRSELLAEIDTLYCRAYVGQNLLKKAHDFCERLLKRDPDSVPALVAQGEQLLAQEQNEEAVRVLTRAFDLTQHTNRDVHQRLQKAQKRLKQSKSKDYYKTLGVARDADARTIKKAYRRLARERHPDKGGSQEQMAELNEAFGVLGNDELRARYDQGDDPNDPMANQQAAYDDAFGGGNPFAHFFQQGGFPQGGFQQQFQQGGFHFQQGGGGAHGQQFHFAF